MLVKSIFFRSFLQGLALSLVLLPLACERATDLRVEGDGFVVVECVLTQEERQTVRLALSERGPREALERLEGAWSCVCDERIIDYKIVK